MLSYSRLLRIRSSWVVEAGASPVAGFTIGSRQELHCDVDVLYATTGFQPRRSLQSLQEGYCYWDEAHSRPGPPESSTVDTIQKSQSETRSYGPLRL